MVLEIVGSLLFAAGLVVLVLAAMHGVVELAGLRRIGAPPPRTFARMITQAMHRQTIALPAIGALVAGWLVSLSASFVFVAFTTNPGGWQGAVGCGLFLAAFVLLAAMLDIGLRRVGDPADLLRDPWAIRAAAQESAAGVPGSIEPHELRQALDHWSSVRSARSLGVTRYVRSPFLDAVFDASRPEGSSGRSVIWRRACVISLAAAARLPWRFTWPLMGLVGVGLGLMLMVHELEVWQGALVLLVSLTVSVVPVLFHSIVLGLRALRLDALHEDAVGEAADAVAQAEAARANPEREPDGADRVLLRIGSLRISVTRKCPSGRL